MLLAGCGHAHLEVVRNASAFADRSVDLLLVDPGRFWYSGRGSGLLGGRYGDRDATIDPEALALACGAGHHRDHLVGIDRTDRTATLGSGDVLSYDLLSLNVGSRVTPPIGVDRAATAAVEPVKPIAAIPGLRQRILAAPMPLGVVVLGAGSTGCEIVGNLLHLAARNGLDLRVTLIGSAPDLLPGLPKAVRLRAGRSLAGRGAHLLTGHLVLTIEDGGVLLENGERVGFDVLILATGLQADPLVRSLGLPFDDRGLRITSALLSIADPAIFAAGDCASIEGYDLPKVGVHGVRAGRVLLNNLLATLDNRPLKPFRPQRRYLSILDLADGEGLATRGGLWYGGRAALRVKNILDERFIQRYRNIYSTT